MKINPQRKDVVINLLWKLFERVGAQIVTLIVSIILARSLLPDDFGLIALITIFITISNVFIQSGLGTALIQKKSSDSIDFSTVFFVSLSIATLIYIILFLVAPFIASFFNLPELKNILRVLSLTLFPFSFNSIQNAYVIKTMQFKKMFVCNITSSIISGIIGIVMALLNFGAWALVGQQLSSSIIVCLLMWFTVKWRPRLTFSLERLKSLFSFGWKLLLSSLINTLYNELYSLIIGKKYTSEILGYFNRGKQFPSLIVSNIDSAIQTVMLPVYSSSQDNQQRLKQMMRRSIVVSSFIIFPAMAGLAAVAESLISFVLTDKWLPAVPFLQIYCLFYAFQPIQTANLQTYNAIGRSDIFLKLEIIKKSIGLLILSVSIFFGIYAIAIGAAISSVINTLINAYPNIKLLNYSYMEQLKDILPSLLLSIIMGVVVYCVQFLELNNLSTLVLQIVIGLSIYSSGAYIFKLESFK